MTPIRMVSCLQPELTTYILPSCVRASELGPICEVMYLTLPQDLRTQRQPAVAPVAAPTTTTRQLLVELVNISRMARLSDLTCA